MGCGSGQRCGARRRPTGRPRQERETCLPWSVAEFAFLERVKVAVCLGAFAWDAALRLNAAISGPPAALPRPRPKFGHGAEYDGRPLKLIGSYHPSQQNTFTGKLTPDMLDGVLRRAATVANGDEG